MDYSQKQFQIPDIQQQLKDSKQEQQERQIISENATYTPNTTSMLNSMDNINMIMMPETYKDGTFDLAQSLNDLLTSQISNSNNNLSLNYDFQIFNNDISTSPYLISSLLNNGESNSNNGLINNNNNNNNNNNSSPSTNIFLMSRSSIPHINICKFSLLNIHMDYLKLFYNDFSRVILPLCPLGIIDEIIENKDDCNNISSSSSSPSANKTNISNINPARDFILYYALKESYVLAAVLACGALSAYRRSKSIVDESKYCSYLSTCMSLLGQSLNEEANTTTSNKNDSEKNQHKLKQKQKQKQKGKMEGMIITTLLLTSYNASSNVVKWRPHLETAGRLLIHSSNYYTNEILNNDSESNNIIERETLAFCRTWFFSIEIIAGLTSSLGGTMHDQDWDILEKWVYDDSYLLRCLRINWINLNNKIEPEINEDFNLMLGYSNNLMIITGKLCRIMKSIRIENKKITFNEISWFLTTLESKEIKDYYILSNTAYLNKDFKFNINLGIPIESIEKFDDIEENGDIVYLSWWDICYQGHRMSAIILTLTVLLKLDKNHFLVINAIEETIQYLKFLKTKKKIKSYELMMFQFSVFLVGKWTTINEHRKLVSKYFSDLHDFGNIGALYSMQKLEKIWRNEYDHEEEDIINY